MLWIGQKKVLSFISSYSQNIFSLQFHLAKFSGPRQKSMQKNLRAQKMIYNFWLKCNVFFYVTWKKNTPKTTHSSPLQTNISLQRRDAKGDNWISVVIQARGIAPNNTEKDEQTHARYSAIGIKQSRDPSHGSRSRGPLSKGLSIKMGVPSSLWRRRPRLLCCGLKGEGLGSGFNMAAADVDAVRRIVAGWDPDGFRRIGKIELLVSWESQYCFWEYLLEVDTTHHYSLLPLKSHSESV